MPPLSGSTLQALHTKQPMPESKKTNSPRTENGTRLIARNRKVRHDFEVLSTVEAGMELRGTEVKALREGKVNLKDSYARVDRGELFLLNLHIGVYEAANHFNHDPDRPRKLLLHSWEIRRLVSQTDQRGLTLVPTRLYFKRGKAKVELALARGKRLHDRRRDIADRDARRSVDRALAEARKI